MISELIRVDEVLDAANALPPDARRLLAAALRERSPCYYWTIEKSGRLTCNYGSPARTAYDPIYPTSTRNSDSDDDDDN